MSLFANCSGFSEGQIATLAALRGGTSALAVMATLLLLMVTCAYQSRLDRKLKVYLFVLLGVSISYLTVLSLGVVYHILPASSAYKWCASFGFFDQILSVIQITLLFIATDPIVTFLWSEITGGHNESICCKTNWVLRGLQGTVIVLAALIVISSFVPFVTGTYGMVGGWCGIVSIENDCDVLVAGLMEQIFLWIIYHALISLICILMVLTTVILLLRACICVYRMGNYYKLDDSYGYKHLFFKYIFQLIILVPIFVDFADFVLVAHIHHYSFTKWVLFATVPPISGFLIPLSFLFYVKFGSTKSGENPPHSRPGLHSTADLRAEIQTGHSPYGITPHGDMTPELISSSAYVTA